MTITQVAAIGAITLERHIDKEQPLFAAAAWEASSSEQQLACSSLSSAPAMQACALTMRSARRLQAARGSYMTVWQPLDPATLPSVQHNT